MNKRAMELSINFLVTLIISIVVFGFGIVFIYNLTSESDKLKSMTIEDIDKSIESILCGDSTRVCIGIDKKTVQKGDFTTFGIQLLNIQDTQNYEIQVSSALPIGYKKDKTEIVAIGEQLPEIFPPARTENIKRNQETTIGVGIQIPRSAIAGTYVFDVNIFDAAGQQYVPVQKLYVEVP